MNTSQFVTFLYRLVLRREPEAQGLRDWTAIIEQGGDPMIVFERFWRSEEFAQKPNPYLRRPGAPLTVSSPVTDGVYFLHIPKTAGKSVWRYLQQVFPTHEICPAWNWDDLMTMPRDELDGYRIFRGHFQGYLEGVLQRKLTLITILRDPIERTLSWYFFLRSIPKHPLRQLALSNSLREFCLHPASRGSIEDYQTVSLLTTLWCSGVSSERDYRPVFGPDYPLQYAVDTTTQRKVPPEVSFELAKAALDKFAAVGITEQLSESLQLFSRTLGVADVQEPIHENRTAERPAAADLDQETRRTIEDLTQADRLIYEYARERFLEAVG